MSLLELFCDIDDFWQLYEPVWHQMLLENGLARRRRACQMRMSEMMTIVVHFHQKRFRDFKTYYTEYVMTHLRAEFPGLVSYNRFVELKQRALVPLTLYLLSRCQPSQGIACIDSLPLAVCHNKRIPQHRVFQAVAGRGKSSMGCFYGFKVHLVITDQGEIVAFTITPGNVDDRRPVPCLTTSMKGKLFGDKGYISQPLVTELLARGLELITTLRKNMKKPPRALIETVNDQLKNISQIEHSRHRSLANFMVNTVAALLAYSHQPKKPALRFATDPALLPFP